MASFENWHQDNELQMMAVLRAMPLDALREAGRFIQREIRYREQAGPELHKISEAEKALFHGRG